MREDVGGSFHKDESRARFCCGACKRDFTLVTISGSDEMRVDGPAWCFEGRHALQPSGCQSG